MPLSLETNMNIYRFGAIALSLCGLAFFAAAIGAAIAEYLGLSLSLTFLAIITLVVAMLMLDDGEVVNKLDTFDGPSQEQQRSYYRVR